MRGGRIVREPAWHEGLSCWFRILCTPGSRRAPTRRAPSPDAIPNPRVSYTVDSRCNSQNVSRGVKFNILSCVQGV
eukprot:scaffold39040_cov47-Phaeocystis_antarctica.AAC.1